MAALDGPLGRPHLLADFDLAQREGFPAGRHAEQVVDELPAASYLPGAGRPRENLAPPLDLGGRTHEENELDAVTG